MRKFLKVLFLFVGLPFIGIFIYAMTQVDFEKIKAEAEAKRKENEMLEAQNNAQRAASSASTNPGGADRLYPTNKMTLSKFKWSLEGFGTVAEASFSVENANTYPVRDIELTCKFYAKSGTLLSTARKTIFDKVAAKGKLAVRGFSLGFVHSQSSNASCEIANAIAQ